MPSDKQIAEIRANHDMRIGHYSILDESEQQMVDEMEVLFAAIARQPEQGAEQRVNEALATAITYLDYRRRDIQDPTLLSEYSRTRNFLKVIIDERTAKNFPPLAAAEE